MAARTDQGPQDTSGASGENIHGMSARSSYSVSQNGGLNAVAGAAPVYPETGD